MSHLLLEPVPDPDLLAVLIERHLTGEEPVPVNLERFTQAYREAHRIAVALPEVLDLLEALNVDGLLSVTRQPSEVPHCAGRAANPHERVAMEVGRTGWTCPLCGDTMAHDAGLVGDVEPLRSFGISFPKVEDFRRVLAHAAHPVSMLAKDHPDVASFDRLRHAVDSLAAVTSERPSVPLAPMPTVRDLGLVLDTVEAYERDAETWDGQVSEATRRLRVTFDAAIISRADFLDQLDGRPDLDLVEDEDGAPLPDSVQHLIRVAQDFIVVRESGARHHPADFAEAMTRLRVAVHTVLAESRR